MKPLALAIAFILPAACATAPSERAAIVERTIPIDTVTVKIGDKPIPVKFENEPLGGAQIEPLDPVREHIRQMLMNATI